MKNYISTLFENMDDMLAFSEKLIGEIERGSDDDSLKEVRNVVALFSSLQPQLELFQRYLHHLPQSFTSLQKLKQVESVNTVLMVCFYYQSF